jgi:hypothetical protein
MDATEIMDEIRRSSRVTEKQGYFLEDCAVVVTRSQYRILKQELERVLRMTSNSGPTTIHGMPVFVVDDDTKREPPFVWTGKQPPEFAESP